MGIGIKSLFLDLGVEMEVQVNTGFSPAKSIASRRGAGRVRHAEVRELWMQDKIQKGTFSIIKVCGEDYVADGLTKHVDRSKLDSYMKDCGYTFRDGRHEFCPHSGDV